MAGAIVLAVVVRGDPAPSPRAEVATNMCLEGLHRFDADITSVEAFSSDQWRGFYRWIDAQGFRSPVPVDEISDGQARTIESHLQSVRDEGSEIYYVGVDLGVDMLIYCEVYVQSSQSAQVNTLSYITTRN